jgi:hypothetical protein
VGTISCAISGDLGLGRIEDIMNYADTVDFLNELDECTSEGPVVSTHLDLGDVAGLQMEANLLALGSHDPTIMLCDLVDAIIASS